MIHIQEGKRETTYAYKEVLLDDKKGNDIKSIFYGSKAGHHFFLAFVKRGHCDIALRGYHTGVYVCLTTFFCTN